MPPPPLSQYTEISADFPQVRRYLFGVGFAHAGMSSFPGAQLVPTSLRAFSQTSATCPSAAITATFLIVGLGATAAQLALVILSLLLVSGISAAAVGPCCRAAARKWGDVYSGQIPMVAAMLYIVVVTFAAPLVLRGPEDLAKAYAFGPAWGLGFGFYYSLIRPVFFFIIPGGQEAKFSGLFTFFMVRHPCGLLGCSFPRTFLPLLLD